MRTLLRAGVTERFPEEDYAGLTGARLCAKRQSQQRAQGPRRSSVPATTRCAFVRKGCVRPKKARATVLAPHLTPALIPSRWEVAADQAFALPLRRLLGQRKFAQEFHRLERGRIPIRASAPQWFFANLRQAAIGLALFARCCGWSATQPRSGDWQNDYWAV